MSLGSINLTNFRNFTSATLDLGSTNLIYGNNGSGKTSFLEAIYYLSLGRSFRTNSYSHLIKANSDQFKIFCHIINELQQKKPLGIERHTNGTQRIRFEEKDLGTFTELTYQLPIQIINSYSHDLLESGPLFRRKFLDWGLFYHHFNYLEVWRKYEKILKQRNRILKFNLSKAELDAWTDELVKQGELLDQHRRVYVSELAPCIQKAAKSLLLETEISLTYESGWGDEPFASKLANHRLDELRAGFTLYGPHRADFSVLCQGVPAKHILSRGQQKLLICAMITSQGMLLKNQAKKDLIYLVDDLPAELDFGSRERLMALLLQQDAQLFITAIHRPDGLENILQRFTKKPVDVFHVEHNEIYKDKS